MKSKTNFFAFLILAITLCVQKVNAQEVYLPHYTTKNGLPSNHCYYTLQDRKGFIWIATDAGVSRFDGAVFENFSVDDGLPDNQILQLREDSKGRIWFMALNGQLSYFFNGKIHNQENDKGLIDLNLNGVVVSFLEDHTGKIWFGTNNNLIGVWDGKKTTKITSKSSQKLQNTFIFEDERKNIIAVNNRATFVFSNNSFVQTTLIADPTSYKAIINSGKDVYYINNSGLNKLRDKVSQQVLKIDKSALQKLGYIFVDQQQLWICNDEGATKIGFNGKAENFLNGINVNQVIKDDQGNTWFTTDNGIYKLPQVKDQLYVYKFNHPEVNTFKSVAKDNLGRIWLGGLNGKISITNLKDNAHHLQLPNTSIYNAIKQLKLDAKNHKMYFASEYGLGSVNSDEPTKKTFTFLREISNKQFVVKNFCIDTTSKLTLAMSSGVVIINNRNKLEFSSLKYKEHEDFFKDRSYRVYYDRQQNLWFSNVNGLSEFYNNRLNKHYHKHPILTKRINDMSQLADNSIALATDGYGIILLKDGKITQTLNHLKGLTSNIINKLYVHNNKLWAISNNGINIISFEKKGVSNINALDDVNGVLSADLNDLYVDDHTAYFASNNGLLYFNYKDLQQITAAPKVYITSIVKNSKPVNLGKTHITLKPKEQNLTLNFSAIDFKNRNITYKYRLKAESNWIETKNRRIELSNLEPGEYAFELSAKSQNSDWSQPYKLQLTVEKRFYQTWWFISAAAVLIGYFIYIVGVRITKQQKNKEQEHLLLKNKILMLEQQALQAMMNPHFVFNVMNSIQHYINTQNTASANKILTGFARLIRKNLEICTQSYITLEEEMNYLKLYLNLEKNRFGEKFNFEFMVDDNIDRDETLIPSMLLQPFIENAIWHGIMPMENGGKVTISIKLVETDTLQIKIIDDGIGIDNALAGKTEGHQSKGMTVTRERIALLNQIEPKSIHLGVKQNGKTGTTVDILLPIHR